MKNSGEGWEADFPIIEEVEDYASQKRRFVITCHDVGHGFTVRADEDGREGNGYQFTAYSETTPYSALGRLRQKIHRALATRHITASSGSYQMLHDKLRGRITSNGEGGVVLIVDGIPLGMDALASILATYEGWEFELQIVDALE